MPPEKQLNKSSDTNLLKKTQLIWFLEHEVVPQVCVASHPYLVITICEGFYRILGPKDVWRYANSLHFLFTAADIKRSVTELYLNLVGMGLKKWK